MFAWIEQNLEQIIWGVAISAGVFVVTLVVAGAVIVRMPPDYFRESTRRRREGAKRWTAGRIAKNVGGYPLIAAGAAMLVLPGQGVLVILIGVMLVDFPGKYRVERWIITREKVFKTTNAVRRRFRRPPLEAPSGATSQGEGSEQLGPVGERHGA